MSTCKPASSISRANFGCHCDIRAPNGYPAVANEGVRLPGGHTFMQRPACRIIHTGGRSTASPRSARSSSGSASPACQRRGLLEMTFAVFNSPVQG